MHPAGSRSCLARLRGPHTPTLLKPDGDPRQHTQRHPPRRDALGLFPAARAHARMPNSQRCAAARPWPERAPRALMACHGGEGAQAPPEGVEGARVGGVQVRGRQVAAAAKPGAASHLRPRPRVMPRRALPRAEPRTRAGAAARRRHRRRCRAPAAHRGSGKQAGPPRVRSAHMHG